MTKLNFFAIIANMLEDGEMIDMRIIKEGGILCVISELRIKGKHSASFLHGTPENLDEGFIEKFDKGIEKIKNSKSNTSESPEPSNKKLTQVKKIATKDPEPIEEPKEEKEEVSPKELVVEDNSKEDAEFKKLKADELYEKSMLDGEAAMTARKYEVAEYNFNLAHAIRPDDEVSAKKAAIATRWVDALIAAKIPVERREVLYP